MEEKRKGNDFKLINPRETYVLMNKYSLVEIREYSSMLSIFFIS